MEDPQGDPLAVRCFCVCSGSVLLGDLLGVSRSVECDFLSVLSIYPRIFLSEFVSPLIMPPQGGGIMHGWPSSVCPSVCLSPCLTLSRELKGVEAENWQEGNS